MQRALRTGNALDDRWHIRADGSRFWASGLMMPLRGGAAAGFVKIVRDRTAELAAERRFGLVTSALPGFVWVADADGLVVDTNERFRAYTGVEAGALADEGWLDRIHPDDASEVRTRWARSMQSGEVFRSRHRFRSRDGLYRCFDCQAIPERDEAGRIVHWLAICLDVEDEARARAALERLNLSLEHQATQSTADLAAAIEDLQDEIAARRRTEDALRQSQKMEAIGQLTGGVAHDFNNLLTVIRSSVDLLRKPDLSRERHRRYLDAIAQTSERAAALTGQLLAFARRQPLQPVVFDVAERLQNGAEILRTTLGSRIRLAIDLRCGPCPALADPHQFDTAVLNVVVNARDAISGDGHVTITVSETHIIPARRHHAEQNGSFIKVSIRDSGSGIPKEQLAHIFEPFYTTKPSGVGTGLGLSQVIGFAKQSHGDITVDSTVGQGTTVCLYLPKVDDAAPATLPEEPAAAHSDGGSILVVEDNDMVGDFAAQLLDDLGFRTHRVVSGQAALESLARNPGGYDAVFSDIVMPGISGLELARTLRERMPNLPVVLTTGYSHALADEGLQGFALLKKPYSAGTLSRVLRQVLPRAR